MNISVKISKSGYSSEQTLPYIIRQLGDDATLAFMALRLGYMQDDFVDDRQGHRASRLAEMMRVISYSYAPPKFRKNIIEVSLPSPTGSYSSNHAAALVLHHDVRRIDYQDPHGMAMPQPLRRALRAHFPGYALHNHRMVQQLAGQKDCAVHTTHNLISLVRIGELPLPCSQRLHLQHIAAFEIFSDPDDAIEFRVRRFHYGVCLADLKADGERRRACIEDFWGQPYPHKPAATYPDPQPPATIDHSPKSAQTLEKLLLG